VIRKHLADRRYVLGAAAVLLACILALAIYLGDTGASASASSSPLGLYRTGNSLASQSQCTDAIQAYARALTKDPTFVKAYVGEAACYRSLGSYGQGIVAYSQAIKADPGNPALYIGRSALYQLNGQSGRAGDDCANAEKQSVPTLGTIAQISACYVNVQNYGAEAATLQRALKAFPTNSDLYRTKVGVDETTGNTQAALADAQKAYQYAGTSVQEAQALSTTGDVYANQGDYSTAITEYRGAIRIAPFLADPWAGLAGALTARGQTESAADIYETAERVSGMAASSQALIYRDHGMLLQQIGNRKGAVNAWRTALRLTTDPVARAALRRSLSSGQS
jgi:tetratricopeptide (TPR) repeat protein